MHLQCFATSQGLKWFSLGEPLPGFETLTHAHDFRLGFAHYQRTSAAQFSDPQFQNRDLGLSSQASALSLSAPR